MKFESNNGGFEVILGGSSSIKNNLTFTLTTHRKKESLILENIKLQTWFHICFILEDRNMDVFINSKLKKSKLLTSVPILEQGTLYVSPHGGFKGFIKDLRYFNKKISIIKIKSLYS